VAASSQNAALSALVFLYRRVPRVELPNVENIERARRSKRAPVVFTRAEVEAFLAQLAGTHHLVIGLSCPAMVYSLSRPNDPNEGSSRYSILHCLPVGLAEQPSAGTGTVMRPATLRRYATEAGFSRVEILPIENDLWRFYRLVS